MKCDVSPVFYRNYTSKANVVINQGGTRSGKTYSILQVLIFKYCLQRTGLIIDIVRKTQAEIRDTIIPDFDEILETEMVEGVTIEQVTEHKATYLQYTINGNTVRFIGLDKAQKKRGSKRDILYINEANGITLEDWVQLSIRTVDMIYCDFNPSEEFWIHDVIFNGSKYQEINSMVYDEDRDNPVYMTKTGREKRNLTYEFIKSTYLDNIDFLTPTQVDYIEALIGMDDYYEQVYVHGNLTALRGKIYSNYEFVDARFWETELKYAETFYGLDVGHIHHMALIEVKYHNEAVYERARYLKQNKLDDDLLDAMEEMDFISFNDEIYVDSAASSMIKKLRNKGYNARNSNKDVLDGIRFCQSLKRYICNDGTEDSEEYIKQMQRYKYKQDANGHVQEGNPVKIDDDGPDAMRYAEYTHLRKRINRLGVH